MKMTRSELMDIIYDDEYRNIPAMLAYNNFLGKPWWRIHEELKKEAAKAMIWEGCQTIAVLFDTYGDVIESVFVRVDAEQSKNDIYINTWVYINHELCFDGSIGLEDDALDRCGEVDNLETLKWAVDELGVISGCDLMSEISTIEAAFGQTFTSAEQAREVARRVAPEINSWLTSRLLTKQVQNKIEVAPDKRGGPKL